MVYLVFAGAMPIQMLKTPRDYLTSIMMIVMIVCAVLGIVVLEMCIRDRGACLLEWGEQFQDELTDEYLSVTLKRDEGDSDVRTITLEAHGDRAMELSHLIDKAVQDELA